MKSKFQDSYSQLRELIKDSNNNEHECREFLCLVIDSLIPDIVLERVYVEKERRGASGDSDYIVSFKVQDETGLESVKAYIWELKAPQCFMFEKDTENRLRPTKELIQAENQLLHYYHENKGANTFQNEFCITHPDNIRFGGIIIGCHKRQVKGNYDDEKKGKLLEKAIMIRKKYIYDPLNIKLMNWDYILNLLQPKSTPKAHKVEETKINLDHLNSENIILNSSP